ncbi:MAG: NUDIX hydrolase [Gammaproteobacteria bacterium]|jgi:ADP-ribose pyrophosphatase YjhB (NUDIX family)
MKYCSQCGGRVEFRVPEGDNLKRFVCPDCGTIHYDNPRLVIGCVPEWGERILLCRRAIEPRLGYWTVPAGFMEHGETTEEAAARETLEEARARVAIEDALAMVSMPDIGQVHLMYRARLLEERFAPGPESLEVRLLRESEIPWEDLAFTSVRYALEVFFADRRRGVREFHTTSAQKPPGQRTTP